ncbi:CAP domain-containing protein [Nostoc sp. FACHB-152]|uniref:CAP domain-containing protein n=1 Tax=unclassified Nostoc TaxID=2593658 RepID=UPI0016871F34|nr:MULTISPECIES: CAP domain-containing protein [unclassified Nostoc]MBD2445823.1 CAP domain-containing protein [Nostoc sp. FACHB-152]MBD2468002.1 CAP domain-containing protein [Nostoc sp. FACHB-145]
MYQKHKPQKKLPYMMGLGWVAIAMLTTGCEELIEYLPPLPNLELSPPQASQPSLPTQSSKAADMEAAVRQGINQVRQKNGLQPLKNNEKLAQVARNYSRQMAQKKFFSHTGADGSTLPDRVSAGGITYWMIGENLFTCTNVPRPVPAAIQGWMNSPGHRANILRPMFRETGVGIWRVGNTYYMTQLFLRG